MCDDLPPLTPEQIEAFRQRAYTLDNCGTFYIRGLVDACGRDMEAGERLRAKISTLNG